MKLKNLVVVTFAVIFYCFSCSKKITSNAFYDYEVQSAGIGTQGTSLLKAWGQANTQNEAIEEAKKNAIRAMLFKGIPGSPDMRPLISQPGAEQQNRQYFETFFAKGGTYLRFISKVNDAIDPADRIHNGKQYKVGVVVSVNRNELVKELEAAGIIKKFGL
jgi:hypothetical protein